MGDNVASDRLRAVLREAHAVGIGNHLVGEYHRDPELLSHASQLSQEPAIVSPTAKDRSKGS